MSLSRRKRISRKLIATPSTVPGDAGRRTRCVPDTIARRRIEREVVDERLPDRSTASAGSTASSRRRLTASSHSARKATPNTTGGHDGAATTRGTRAARSPVLDRVARSPARRRWRRARWPRSASRTSVIFSKNAGVLAGVGVAVADRGRRRSTSVIRPGPGRHHDDAVGQVHRLGDRVGDEHDARRRSRRRSAAARPACARGSSRRGRRTARPSAAAAGGRRAPGRWRRAAACRRTAATAGARRSRSSLTSCEHLHRPLRGAWPCPSPSARAAARRSCTTVRQSNSPACWNAMP